MDIATFKKMYTVIPPRQSVLLRGKHGVGKSQIMRQCGADYRTAIVKQLAESDDPADKALAERLKALPLDLKHRSATDDARSFASSFVIDRRLSQMSEGDMVGLPELIDGVTRFCPPAWFMEACHEPRIIFLDEINRATPEVLQAAFQIVLDYELNGWKLHPLTRVVAAINPDQGGYVVNQMDPALLDRFAVIDLEPSREDWFKWAKNEKQGNICEAIVDFLQHNSGHLEHEGGEQEPGKVYPSRRSWELLDHALKHAGLDDCDKKDDILYALALTRVGTEAAIAFQDHVINMDRQVAAEDILNRWSKVKKKVARLGVEKWNILAEKLGDHCQKNDLNDRQAKNLGAYMKTLPGEHMMSLWTAIAESGNINNAAKIHTEVSDLILKVLNNDENKDS